MVPNQNNINGNQISFCQLVESYSISIPIIQRDYAQGREQVSEIRDSFLTMLYNCLNDDKSDSLDFIYGFIENNNLIPLDGQQRLTTLFLLHLYISLIDDECEDFKNKMLDSKGNSKFSYETRVSSADFCNAIIQNISLLKKNISNDINGYNISYNITNSSWFYLSWNNDPTIRSMLNMLNAIEEKFRGTLGLYKKLIDTNSPLISFKFLRLDDLMISDDIYIKMNARGKLLTNFESLKAWLEKYIKDNSLKIDIENWEVKFDVEWTDLFWTYKNPDKFEIDDNFYNYFQLMTLYFYIENEINIKSSNVNIIPNVNKLLNEGSISYSLLNKVLNEEGLNKTLKFLHYIENNGYSQIGKISDKLFNSKDYLLNKIIGTGVIENYWELTYMYSFILFTIEKEKQLVNYDDDDLVQLFRWLRITKNLIFNTTIDKVEDFITAIGKIKELADNVKFLKFKVYEYFSNPDSKLAFISPTQLLEEQVKSNIILNDINNRWENTLIKYENHPYFYGQIGFLLEFSKSNEGTYDFDLFINYSEKAAIIFGDIINKDKEFVFERALLTKGDYLEKLSYNYNFCKPDYGRLRTLEENWRRVFKNKSDCIKCLLDDIKLPNVKTELNRIIGEYLFKVDNEIIEQDWRYHIIRNKDMIAYCKEKQIRKENENDILLLTKTSLRGYHAELYSYSLYCNHLKNHSSNFQPFYLHSYEDVYGYYFPSIIFTVEINQIRYRLQVIFVYGIFKVSYSTLNDIEIPENIKLILLNLDFKIEAKEYVKQISKNSEIELIGLINSLAMDLSSLNSN